MDALLTYINEGKILLVIIKEETLLNNKSFLNSTS